MATSWTVNDILQEAQKINVVYSSPLDACCTPKMHEAPRGTRKMETYRVIIERFPGGEGKEHQGIWREFRIAEDDDEALYRTELPSATGHSHGGLKLDAAKELWINLCRDYHGEYHDDEHFQARCKGQKQVELDGEKARAKLVLLEIMNIMPDLFISPLENAQWDVHLDAYRVIRGTTSLESFLPPLERVVPECLPRATRAMTDLEEWSLYVVSDAYMSSHKSLRSACVATKSFLNVHTSTKKMVGMFLAKDWWLAQRAFSSWAQDGNE
ncbi:hypothetical protein V5O48_016535 [Marasmius crinis-equi]|uniref:Uncharacterized protein n=1 Tax=Marasmius crinis-equi TaxID=585013 RepID=A0ABR3ERH9_9AGAR